MNREETLALYAKGVEAWNEWAEEMLAERKQLEEAGEWDTVQSGFLRKFPKNQTTRTWLERAKSDFSHADDPHTFNEDINFTGFIFPAMAQFQNAIFNYDTSCRDAKFIGDTTFNQATFQGSATFVGTDFGGCTLFHNVSFNNEVFFNEASFKDTADFAQVTFNAARFYSASFSARAIFTKASFKGEAIFENASFRGEVIFENSFFKFNTSFISARFRNITRFDSVSFADSAQFGSAEFNDLASFTSAGFGGNAWFKETSFSKAANFHNARFNDTADFNQVIFSGQTWFDLAEFNQRVSFQNSRFKQAASFVQAIFNGQTEFNDANFSENALFRKTRFHHSASFTAAVFKRFTTFQDAIFKQNVDFNAIRSESAFSLEGVGFEQNAPDFIQAHFEEAPRLDHIELGRDVEPGGFWASLFKPLSSDVKARYQALKRLAIQAHDHENEQLFWAGELRSDRSLRTQAGKWNIRPVFSAFWWGNIAYGLFSNYGSSIARPLISWVLLIGLMTLVHLNAHFHSHNIWAAPQEPKDQTQLSYREDRLDYIRLREARKPYPETLSQWVTQTVLNKGTPPFELEGISSQPCDPFWDGVHIAVKTGAIGLGWDRSKRGLYVQKYMCLYGPLDKKETTPAIPNHILWKEMGQMVFSAVLIFLLLLGIRNNFKLK